MNAYELADEAKRQSQLIYLVAEEPVAKQLSQMLTNYETMLRQQADQLDKVIPQLVKANGLIENLRIRIAELEKWEERWSKRCQRQQDRIAELEKLAEEMKYEKSSGVYTHPVKQLSDEDLDKLIKDAEQGGYMEMYIVGLIDGFNHARAIIKEITE